MYEEGCGDKDDRNEEGRQVADNKSAQINFWTIWDGFTSSNFIQVRIISGIRSIDGEFLKFQLSSPACHPLFLNPIHHSTQSNL